METRAHHLLIGAFMLVMTIALFAFLIWFIKGDLQTSFTEYEIYFDESVAGLPRGSDVLFNGIPVGQVRDISIPLDAPSKVRVLVRIESDVPIHEDATASLSLQGLTGVFYVEIQGGTPQSGLLQSPSDGSLPVIQSRPSPFQSLFEEAPNLMAAALTILDRAERMLSEENIEKFNSIMSNVQATTGTVAENSETIINDLVAVTGQLKTATDNAQSLIANLDTIVEEDAVPLMQDLRKTVSGANEFVVGLNRLMENNEGAVTAFANTSLPEISLLISDARRLATTLTQLASQLEENPSQFIFAPPKPIYEPR